MTQSTPKKAGIYQAKLNCFHWFNLIVFVKGEAPMLYIKWAFDMANGELRTIKPEDIESWGREIESWG